MSNITDLNGNELKIGSMVRYIRTGTTGKVTNITSDNGVTWATMDTTDLLYDTRYLEVIEEVKKKEIGEKIFTAEEIEKAMEELEEQIDEVKAYDEDVESGG
ncbi:MAG TPA: DUF2098 domain-containing protein [Methanosarcinales archaeon]|nr:DUF2098 domain-containing protein [Methanosarcinales archaeon]